MIADDFSNHILEYPCGIQRWWKDIVFGRHKSFHNEVPKGSRSSSFPRPALDVLNRGSNREAITFKQIHPDSRLRGNDDERPCLGNEEFDALHYRAGLFISLARYFSSSFVNSGLPMSAPISPAWTAFVIAGS